MALMQRIALTGGIAAGKSTVAQHLKTRGIAVIDYDELAHQLQEPHSPAIAALTARFGNDILNADGGIDRARLAQRVFQGDYQHNLQDLNAIMHPLVYELVKGQEARIMSDHQSHVIVHDIPLLADVADTIPFSFAHVMNVEAPQEVRIARLMQSRGLSEAQARARVQAQGDDEMRARLSDGMIDSTVPIEQMFENVDALIALWNEQMEDNHGI